VNLRSVNGPEFTTIRGCWAPGTTNGDSAIRCVYLTNGASLTGFTLTNGATRLTGNINHERSGGGLWAMGSATASNCIFAGNAADYKGAGAFSGTIHNSTIRQNATLAYGGGVYFSRVNNSSLLENYAWNAGGGAYDAVLDHCLVISNRAFQGAGATGGTLSACDVRGNSAQQSGGGILNSMSVQNCTVLFNSAISGGGTAASRILNSIVYYNTASFSENNDSPFEMRFCCTTPLPSGGVDNIEVAPGFVDLASGNFRLDPNSPCINSGNNTFAGGAFDLDGLPRIQGSTVDIGAYEYQQPLSVLSYAWALQYGLPLAGFQDFDDADDDGMNNWSEWMAGTNPTNAASVLKLLPPERTPPDAVTLKWQGTPTRSYFIERTTQFGGPAPLSCIISNIIGVATTNSYTDATATNTSYYYRLGVVR